MVLPLFSGNGILSRLSSIFLGFAPPFLLLSIGFVSLQDLAIDESSLVIWIIVLFSCLRYLVADMKLSFTVLLPLY